jgi:large subunit ribosomal protein L2
MGIKSFRPTTPNMRFTVVSSFDDITRDRPERSLLEPRKQKAGRSSATGRITVRHRGGGHKRMYRVIDFKRDKPGVPATVASIEYDPNRSVRIALLNYRDGEKRYILAPEGVKVGSVVVAGAEVEPVPGNALPLERIPLGYFIHNIEIRPGAGGQMVRTAGGSAQLMAKEGGFVQVRMPSGEMRLVNARCMATVGRLSHAEHSSLIDGKAGRRRWRGVRPTVRGVVMNPVDHPMGGGEGRTSGGGHPVSPWGKLAKAGRTRKKRNPSNRFILNRRK